MCLVLRRPSPDGERMLCKNSVNVGLPLPVSTPLEKQAHSASLRKQFILGLGAISLGYTTHCKKYLQFQDPEQYSGMLYRVCPIGLSALACPTFLKAAEAVEMTSCQGSVKFLQMYLLISPSQSSER